MCSGFLCHVCVLISLSSWLFLWFLFCRLVQVLFLSLVVNISLAIFLLLPLDWICYQVHVLTSYSFFGAPRLRIA
jgi:hypothetical protein